MSGLNRARRILIILIVAALFSTGSVFAAAAAIISPAQNTIVYTDSLLVSVKVTEPKTVRIAVFEEKEKSGENLVSVNVSSFTEADLTAIATPTEEESTKKYTSASIGEAVLYKCESTLGFYTKQISDVKPGLYRVQVDTLKQDGTSGETVQSYVAVKVKPPEEKVELFKAPQNGALQFLQTFFKNIFR